jgi:hypothetical protein
MRASTPMLWLALIATEPTKLLTGIAEPERIAQAEAVGVHSGMLDTVLTVRVRRSTADLTAVRARLEVY